MLPSMWLANKRVGAHSVGCDLPERAVKEPAILGQQRLTALPPSQRPVLQHVGSMNLETVAAKPDSDVLEPRAPPPVPDGDQRTSSPVLPVSGHTNPIVRIPRSNMDLSHRPRLRSTSIAACLACLAFGPFSSAQSPSVLFDKPAYARYLCYSGQWDVGDLNQDSIPDIVIPNRLDFWGKALVTMLGQGNGHFTAPTQIALSTNSDIVRLGDFNENGALDIIYSVESSASLHLLLGNGAGSFAAPLPRINGLNVKSMTVADINHDGHLDIVSARTSPNVITVLIGSGTGEFAAPQDIALAFSPLILKSLAFNADAFPDLAVLGTGASGLAVFTGSASGSYALTATVSTGSVPRSLEINDFNGDGHEDVAVLSDSVISFMFSSGAGAFSATTQMPVPNALAMAAGDVTGDLSPDLAVQYGGAKVDLKVFANNGNASFQELSLHQGLFTAAGYTPLMGIIDLNDDSRGDLILSDRSATALFPLLTILSDGDDSFAEPLVLPDTSYRPGAVGDFNGDSNLDIAYPAQTTGMLFLGNDDGSFETTTGLALTNTVHALAGDMNGDGFDDLISFVGYSPLDIAVQLSDGTGSFGAPQLYPAGSGSPFRSTLAHLNGDGIIDLVFNKTSGGINTYLGTPSAGFVAGAFISAPGLERLAVADVSGDGVQDLITAGAGFSASVYVRMGDGNGGFGVAYTYPLGTSGYAYGITANDFDGNGTVDVAVACSQDLLSTVRVLLNQGTGTYGAAITYSIPSVPNNIASGHLNSDGFIDLAVVTWQGVSILSGIGNGTFGQYQAFNGATSLGGDKTLLAVNDLDSDGDNDILVVTGQNQKGCVNAMLNRSSPHGYVQLGQNHVPMRQVRILASDPTTNVIVATATTARDGSYRFTNVPNGTWRIGADVSNPAGGYNVVNYPNDDFNSTWSFQANQSVVRIPTIIFPDPLVMQSGLWASAETWGQMISYLTMDAGINADKRNHKVPSFLCYPVDVYNNNAYSVKVLDEDADILRAFVDNIDLSRWIGGEDLHKVRYGFIGHSMGGLIIRGLITSGNSRPTSRLMTLDTPHGGVMAATYAPGFRGLSEANLNGTALSGCTSTKDGWNQKHLDNGYPMSERTWFAYSCVYDKIVMPDLSGIGKARRVHKLTGLAVTGCTPFNAVRAVASYVNDSHSGIHGNALRMRECALFFARGTIPSPGSPAQAFTPPNDPTDSMGKLQTQLTASPGMNHVWQFGLDANTELHFRCIGPSSGISYSITGANGHPMMLSVPDVGEIASGVTLQTMYTSNPAKGTVTINLSSPNSTSNLNLELSFPNGRRLSAGATPEDVAAVGGSALLSASLLDRFGNVIIGSAASAQADILRPDGTSISLTLLDDGLHQDGQANDGVFAQSATAAVTTIPGVYWVSYHGKCTLSGDVVQRSHCGTFAVLPAVATLAGSITAITEDTDSNGFADNMVITAGFTLPGAGEYKLLGSLKDYTGQVIQPLTQTISHAGGAGVHAIALRCSGPVLHNHGVAGPWTLEDIELVQLDQESLPVATVPSFTTPLFDLALFERPHAPRCFVVIPASGPVLGNNEVLLRGRGFYTTSNVYVGAVAAAFTVVDDGTLIVTVPATNLPPPYPRSATIRVVTEWGVTSLPSSYTYQ